MTDDPGTKVGMRKAAGIMLLVIGIPNTLVGVALFLAGVVGAVILGITIISMLITDPSSDAPFAELCWIFIMILIILAFILLLGAVIVVGFLSLGFISQIIAGYFALKGKRFGWTMALSIFGTVTSFLAPCVILVSFLIADQKYPLLFIPAFLEALIAMISLAATIMVGMSRKSFEPPKPKASKAPKAQMPGPKQIQSK
jgi:hypothetical protein